MKPFPSARKWEDDMDSHMVMGDELQEIFNETYDQIKKRELKVLENLENLNQGIGSAIKALEQGQ